LAVADREPRTAARLVGAATAIREAIDFPRDDQRNAWIADIRNQAGAELGSNAVRDLEAEGEKMPIEQATELALSLQAGQAVGG
jgi:hypothetical protein